MFDVIMTSVSTAGSWAVESSRPVENRTDFGPFRVIDRYE